ncbi:hypothetical protein OC25_07385 [Pedobacter kyungheensis]|uniref:Uncharacterized protein n=1 Tax=Pedobacter kyungheensis TaxID=1069985 RepID=A0A0C1G4W0_9SPHI|nr:hypothetical protein OC25_07385 [Pedobacter kyungheensis]
MTCPYANEPAPEYRRWPVVQKQFAPEYFEQSSLVSKNTAEKEYQIILVAFKSGLNFERHFS